MANVLVVIGSVTAKQCEPARLELLRGGYMPRVMHVSEEESLKMGGSPSVHLIMLFVDGHTLSPLELAFAKRNVDNLVPGTSEIDYVRTFWGFEASDVVGVVFTELAWLRDNIFDVWATIFPRIAVRFVVYPDGCAQIA